MGDKQKAELLCKERPFFSLQYLGFCFPLCSDFPGFSFLSQLSSKGNKKIWMKLETFGTTLRNSFWVFQIPGYASSNGLVLFSPPVPHPPRDVRLLLCPDPSAARSVFYPHHRSTKCKAEQTRKWKLHVETLEKAGKWLKLCTHQNLSLWHQSANVSLKAETKRFSWKKHQFQSTWIIKWELWSYLYYHI